MSRQENGEYLQQRRLNNMILADETILVATALHFQPTRLGWSANRGCSRTAATVTGCHLFEQLRGLIHFLDGQMQLLFTIRMGNQVVHLSTLQLAHSPCDLNRKCSDHGTGRASHPCQVLNHRCQPGHC